MKLLFKRSLTAKPFGSFLLLSALLIPNCCQGQSLSKFQLNLADAREFSNDDTKPSHTACYVDLKVLEKRVGQNETKIEQLNQRLELIEFKSDIVKKQVESVTSNRCNNQTMCSSTELRTAEALQPPQTAQLVAPVYASWPAASVATFGSGNSYQSYNATFGPTETLPLPSSLPMATFVEVAPWVKATNSISQPTLQRSTERILNIERPIVSRGLLSGRLMRGRNIQRSRKFSSQPQAPLSSCRIVNGVRICN